MTPRQDTVYCVVYLPKVSMEVAKVSFILLTLCDIIRSRTKFTRPHQVRSLNWTDNEGASWNFWPLAAYHTPFCNSCGLCKISSLSPVVRTHQTDLNRKLQQDPCLAVVAELYIYTFCRSYQISIVSLAGRKKRLETPEQL